MKKIIAILMAAVLVLAFAGCGKTENNKAVENNSEKEVPARSHVLMTVAGLGEVTIELIPEYAPATVENFLSLVKDGFYDGLTFHRVISGFMVQGGDPEGTGMGGSDKNIFGEFAANGFKQNKLKHSRGVISMARTNHPDSATSQFFICHGDCFDLDGQYAGFGKVIKGIEVIDKIAEVETDEADKPLSDVVIESIKVIELGE
ncbi:MAG: peptidylprolyl isomerase [Clostridia bacterium]|nr:peptidylprolyl isomerase [Clostridia bacterium]